ncbi:MAG: hypothetical protein NTZ73_04145 [Candidatus Diapherotrites archaeon]|nr:hypothetical protein [Candidatus Diapherotrites archaeon]
MALIWFLVSYSIFWFIGGACTNIFSGGKCLSAGALDGFRGIPIIGSILPYDTWSSLMFFFAPLTGFALCYFVIRWFNEYFETKVASSLLFFVLLVIALYFGYMINLAWHYGNNAALAAERNGISVSLYFCFNESTCSNDVDTVNKEYAAQYQSGQSTKLVQFLPVNYWPELRKSMYLIFMLGAIAAWLPFFVLELYEKQKES